MLYQGLNTFQHIHLCKFLSALFTVAEASGIAVLFILKVTVTLVLVITNILQGLVYFIFYFYPVFISGSYALVHTI